MDTDLQPYNENDVPLEYRNNFEWIPIVEINSTKNVKNGGKEQGGHNTDDTESRGSAPKAPSFSNREQQTFERSSGLSDECYDRLRERFGHSSNTNNGPSARKTATTGTFVGEEEPQHYHREHRYTGSASQSLPSRPVNIIPLSEKDKRKIKRAYMKGEEDMERTEDHRSVVKGERWEKDYIKKLRRKEEKRYYSSPTNYQHIFSKTQSSHKPTVNPYQENCKPSKNTLSTYLSSSKPISYSEIYPQTTQMTVSMPTASWMHSSQAQQPYFQDPPNYHGSSAALSHSASGATGINPNYAIPLDAYHLKPNERGFYTNLVKDTPLPTDEQTYHQRQRLLKSFNSQLREGYFGG